MPALLLFFGLIVRQHKCWRLLTAHTLLVPTACWHVHQAQKQRQTKNSICGQGELLYFANLNYLGMASEQFIPIYARALQTQEQFTSRHLLQFTQYLLKH